MTYTRTQPVWLLGEGGGTAVDPEDLENYDKGLLATNNDLVVLLWNGTTYLPKNGDTTARTDNGKARLFIGPVDPATVTGVVLADGDRWDQYT